MEKTQKHTSRLQCYYFLTAFKTWLAVVHQNVQGSLPKKGAGATLAHLLHIGQSIQVNILPYAVVWETCTKKCEKNIHCAGVNGVLDSEICILVTHVPGLLSTAVLMSSSECEMWLRYSLHRIFLLSNNLLILLWRKRESKPKIFIPLFCWSNVMRSLMIYTGICNTLDLGDLCLDLLVVQIR